MRDGRKHQAAKERRHTRVGAYICHCCQAPGSRPARSDALITTPQSQSAKRAFKADVQINWLVLEIMDHDDTEVHVRNNVELQRMGQGHGVSTAEFYSPSLPKFTTGAFLLEPAVVRRLDSMSFSAASAASIHSE